MASLICVNATSSTIQTELLCESLTTPAHTPPPTQTPHTSQCKRLHFEAWQVTSYNFRGLRYCVLLLRHPSACCCCWESFGCCWLPSKEGQGSSKNTLDIREASACVFISVSGTHSIHHGGQGACQTCSVHVVNDKHMAATPDKHDRQTTPPPTWQHYPLPNTTCSTRLPQPLTDTQEIVQPYYSSHPTTHLAAVAAT